MKLYHATFQAHLDSILEGGLVPGHASNWEGCASGYVYLAKDSDAAISFCEAAESTPEDVYDSGICCFEIDSKSLDPALLKEDPNILKDADEESQFFAYAGTVPSNLLRLFYQAEHMKPSLLDQIQAASERSIDAQGNQQSMVLAKPITSEQRQHVESLSARAEKLRNSGTER